jgi:hypothetical protein
MPMPSEIEMASPTTAPIPVASGVELSPMAKRKRAVSTPSRRTAKKTTEASPIAEPAAMALASLASSSCLMLAACFLIQKIIQVRTETAQSIATPSKICSERPSSSPMVKKSAAPAATETATAAAVPSQMRRK